jgi:putative two-component system response regulator
MSEPERQLMRAHTSIGGDLLGKSAEPELRCAEIVARHHHERWDGQGYPTKLAGKRIPVECRVVAIADCFDAMTHGRPHVKRVTAGVALGEIELQKGKQFDPELADDFIAFMRALLSEHSNIAVYLEQGASRSPIADAMRELGDLRAAIPEHGGRAARSMFSATHPEERSSAANSPGS